MRSEKFKSEVKTEYIAKHLKHELLSQLPSSWFINEAANILWFDSYRADKILGQYKKEIAADVERGVTSLDKFKFKPIEDEEYESRYL